MPDFRWRRIPAARAALALLAAVAFAAAAAAQTSAGDSTTAPTEASSKLSFHAYINQAYARSDDHQIYGIPTDGTTNYASLAVQLRYQLTPDDSVAVQLGHDRLGKSTLNSVSDDVSLDWAFYQRRLTDETSVKVGRVQLPLGIYNEVQDVGTVLPLFTAPQTIYLKTRTTEAVDGLMLSHSFGAKSPWSVDSDFYAGSWDRTEQSPGTGTLARARAEDAFGTQLWLNTPLSGVRFGLAALTFEETGGLNQVKPKDHVRVAVLSYDGTFDRFFTRAEYLYAQQPARLAPGFVSDKLVYFAYYGQVGYAITPQLKVNLQAEQAKYDLNLGSGAVLTNRDVALGLAFFFNATTVFKLEGHHSYGTQAENERTGRFVTTNYGLASAAISF
ncbi:MAG TPA: hypothetical protein VGE98_11785 [Thermoanaerobaculia bacterium]